MSMFQSIKYHLMAKSRDQKYTDFMKLACPSPADAILDVGAANREFSSYDNHLEKRYPYPSRITALSIQDLSEFNRRYPEIKAVTYQGGPFPFPDKAFFVVHSNAVLEHVGSRRDQIVFIKEMARCGERFFFSTPAREFPFEIHTSYPFLHWLPKSLFDFLLVRLGKGWASGNYMNLLTGGGLKRLLEEADIGTYRIRTYRLWGLPYQYVVFGRTTS